VPGPPVVLAGSCSAMTLRQLAALESTGLCTIFRLNVERPDDTFASAMEYLTRGHRVVIASSAAPDERTPGAAAAIEHAFARAAHAFVLHTSNIIVAGGETSGAVVEALGVEAAEVEAILAPGVPALRTLSRAADRAPLRLALKSGNFGGVNFFAEAIRYLEQ
jgi:3-dehydrotetronate 4-kinase